MYKATQRHVCGWKGGIRRLASSGLNLGPGATSKGQAKLEGENWRKPRARLLQQYSRCRKSAATPGEITGLAKPPSGAWWKALTSRACTVPQPLSAEAATARAIKRNPARMTKLARGQRPAQFQAFTVSQLLETYQDPRAVLLSIASMDTAALAKLCQCSMMDAIAERRLCAQAVIPYVAQKLRVQLDVRTAKTINLNLLSPVEFAEVEKLANTDEASDSDG